MSEDVNTVHMKMKIPKQQWTNTPLSAKLKMYDCLLVA